MTVRCNTYLAFDGDARQAMEFYQSVFGGELELRTFAEMGRGDDPEQADKIMHAMLEGDHGVVLMASDMPHEATGGFAISLSGDDDEVLRGWWESLSSAGTVHEPLVRAPWGDHFGMCADQFGINWMVNIAGTPD